MDVRDGTAEQRSLALYNGVPAVGLDLALVAFTGAFDDLWGDIQISTRAEATDARLFDRPLAALGIKRPFVTAVGPDAGHMPH